MPVGTGKYRVVQTPKGPVRLHFTKGGVVNEAKNLKTGATHHPAEFAADEKQRAADKQKMSIHMNARLRGHG